MPERRSGQRFKAIILHDAEDIVHRGEIALFDRLIEDHALVQIPVRPLPDRHSRWIANHYCDEFAEAHGKDLVVRTMLGAGIPSAGVGCAIDRAILGEIAAERDGRPFDDQSLTEDYELGLRIAARGGRGIFVRMCETVGGDLIAVRSHFPPDLNAAVRQKTRWVTGIALAGWERLGWHGGWAEGWMRLRDRATMLAALVLFAAYAALLLGVVLIAIASLTTYSPAPPSPLLKALLALNFGLLSWRLAMRALFTVRSYGWREGLWAIPRAVTSNVIAMMAARRALVAYVRSNPAMPPRWEKTRHIFPDFGAGG